MKRRVKLLATVLSMSLVLCVMGFGVYAATSHKLTVDNRIAFTSTDVFVDITANAKLGTTVLGEGLTLSADVSSTSALAKTWVPREDIEFTAENSVLTYTFNFTNVGEVTAVVKFTGLSQKPDALKVTYSVTVGANEPVNTMPDGTSAFAIRTGETMKVVMSVELVDFSESISAYNAGFTVDLAKLA